MKTEVDHRVVILTTGHKSWFGSSENSIDLISRTVSSSVEGVYCIWWKDPTSFPAAKTIELPAGKRGVISLALKSWKSDLAENIALYVGKGGVRTRLASHLKPVRSTDAKQSRNPYEWLATIFSGKNIDSLIRDNLGFSFIKEPNKLEQIYTENLAIGILRPWFNLRLTA